MPASGTVAVCRFGSARPGNCCVVGPGTMMRPSPYSVNSGTNVYWYSIRMNPPPVETLSTTWSAPVG